jgi:acetylglutamate kinase
MPLPTVVIKYGGNAMKSLALRRAIATEIAALRASHRVVVVHGGGPVIERDLERVGIPSQFKRGLRVTTPDALEVIEKALTQLNKELAQDVGAAIGLTGRDMALLQAELLEPDGDLGRVGRVTGVNTALLETLLTVNLTPVIGCIAVDASGEALNINADWAAGAVAGALRCPVVFLTDVAGVMRDHRDPSTLESRLGAAQVQAMIADGSIAGGMIPKVEAALHALERGASTATVASGMTAGVLEAALRGGAGTTVSHG